MNKRFVTILALGILQALAAPALAQDKEPDCSTHVVYLPSSPAGRLPITAEMLLGRPSGDVFELSPYATSLNEPLIVEFYSR